MHNRFRLRGNDPFGKIPLPYRYGLTPDRVARHHIRRALDKTAMLQNTGNLPAESEKVLMRFLLFPFRRFSVKNRVILIGTQQLLLAAFAPERKPAERNVGTFVLPFLFKFFQGKINSPCDDCIIDFRNDVGNKMYGNLLPDIHLEQAFRLVSLLLELIPV